MKLAIAKRNNQDIYGMVKNSMFFSVKSNVRKQFPTFRSFLEKIDLKQGNQPGGALEVSSVFESIGYPLATITLLPPVTKSNKIICVGLNYPKLYNEEATRKPEHIILFSKFHETIVGAKEPLLLPEGEAKNSLDYEAEVAIIIGKAGFRITKETAKKHILGFTLFNDGSVREWQKHSIDAGKNFYRSGACGPYVVTKDEINSNSQINFKAKLNGKLVQSGNLDEMFFNINEIIAYVSAIFPLNPGDIIATGSPEGTGASQTPKRFLKEGDVIEISSDILGTLSNKVMKNY